MLHVSTKDTSVGHTFVNVKFNEVLEFVASSKFEGLTLFRNVNHEGVDTVSVTVAH
jgi:hypothetical protein